MERRVVVTGLGVVAPNGADVSTFWQNIVEGRSGIDYIESFDTSGHTVKIGGEIKRWDPTPYLNERVKRSRKIMPRAVQFGLAASEMAAEASGIFEGQYRHAPDRVGVVMGTGIIPVNVQELATAISMSVNGKFQVSRFAQIEEQSLEPLWLLRHLPNMVAAHVSLALGCEGPNNTIVTACAASTQAVGEAFRLIRYGYADAVIAGGADSRIDPLLYVAYTVLGAVSTSNRPPQEVSRPFDALRDGFVLAEGGAALVLEEYEHARRRGAQIYAEVVGYGSSFDAYSITRPDPEGKGAARAMEAALREARLNPEDISYINAHGTSTRLNDVMETVAIKRVFGPHAYKVPCSSIKSMIGHLIGASGAVEAVASVLTVKEGIAPPTINLEAPDPECDLDYVPNEAREIKVKAVMSNSFGFGGQNAAIIFKKI